VLGKGGEMTQTLYAHMNKIKIKRKTSTKRAGGVAQVVVCLHSNHEALSSNPSTTIKEKELCYVYTHSYMHTYIYVCVYMHACTCVYV
jgi:hypothetical protein